MSRMTPPKALAAVAGASAAVGVLLATRPELILWALGAALALVCPLWVLPSTAIAATALAPPGTAIGSVQIADVLFGILLVRTGWRVLLKSSEGGVLSRPEWWLVGFLAWAWLSLLAVGALDAAPALARVTLYAAVFATLTRVPGCARPLMTSIVALAVAEVGLALVLGQVGERTSATFANTAGCSTETTTTVLMRFTGTTGDPGTFGFIQLAALASTLVLPKPVRWLVVPVILAGIALTFTRGIWASAVVEVALLAIPALRVKPIRIVLVAAGLVAVALAAAPAVTEQLHLNPESRQLRLDSIRGGLELTEAHPLLGVGWAQAQPEVLSRSSGAGGRGARPTTAACGRTAYRQDARRRRSEPRRRAAARGRQGRERVFRQHADREDPTRVAPYNLWVNVASTTGVPGALLLTGFLGATLLLLARHRNSASQGALIFLAGFLVLSTSEMLLYAGGLPAMLFFVLLGVGVAATRHETAARGSEESLDRRRLAASAGWRSVSRAADEP